MAKLTKKLGYPKPRVLTDVSGPRYWTVVTEIEVENLDEAHVRPTSRREPSDPRQRP